MSKDAAVDFSAGDSLMIDLDSVEDDSGFEVLPRGMYPVVISECEFQVSAAGNPMWSMRLEVEEDDYAGRLLFNHLTFAGGGLPITKRVLSRIRPALLEGPFDPQDEDTIAGMLGIRAKAKVTIRKYQGEDRNNVADVFAGDDDDSFA